jgi:Tfp pilus assembly protein FimT
MIELLVTLAIVLILSAVAIPLVQSGMTQYKLRSAVASVTGAIQSTRYRAISSGYAFRLVMDSTNLTYQVQSDPNRTATFANVGGAVPLSSSSTKATLNADTTLQFRPSGLVSATTGSMTMIMTLGNKTETITVSNYGNINVTP